MTLIEAKDFSHSYDAIPASVPLARRALAEFAEAAGVNPEKLDAVRLATSEALTNAVIYAYRGTPGRIHVWASVASDELWILISDDGDGLHSGVESTGLGVGLALIAELADGFAIVDRAEKGIEVRMRFDLEAASTPDLDQLRGSSSSAHSPASPLFSTTR